MLWLETDAEYPEEDTACGTAVKGSLSVTDVKVSFTTEVTELS
jgi:hypothetical protein